MKQNSDLKTAYAIKASFYFFAFSFGSSLPYLAPFFKEHYGASDHQIGILLMIRPAIALALQPLWSLIVDTSGRRSLLAALLSLLAGLSFPFILLAHSYTMIIILLAVWAIFHGPLWSLGDSIAFDYLGHHRRLRLANFRIFGSLGWITAVLLVGKSIDSLGIQWLFPFYSISVILSGYFIFNIPSSTKTPFMTGKKAIKDLLKKQNIRLLIFVLLLAGIANQMAYSFLSLYGKSL